MDDIKKPTILNLSGSPLRINFDIRNIKKLILLPDYSPSRGKLPVGTVAVFDKNKHKINRDYLGTDVGCGMLLAKIKNFKAEYMKQIMCDVASEIILNRQNGFGSLGRGNHFITLYQASNPRSEGLKDGDYFFLIHSGSGEKGRDFYDSNLSSEEYLAMQYDVLEYARKSRLSLARLIEEKSGSPLELLFDRPHNTIESNEEELTYRKGAVKMHPGEIGVLSSSMAGEAYLIRAKDSISDLSYSMSHATGRKISRSEAKKERFFLNKLPNDVYIPYFISPETLNTEFPQCYRTIDEVAKSLDKYVDFIDCLNPKATIMH